MTGSNKQADPLELELSVTGCVGELAAEQSDVFKLPTIGATFFSCKVVQHGGDRKIPESVIMPYTPVPNLRRKVNLLCLQRECSNVIAGQQANTVPTNLDRGHYVPWSNRDDR
jgi:hypothetical protein